ncbi:hypothetical protein COB55_03290 [Candidatus Wolfebacteria bacterium]|nr:MAG: hypothetical protein COB55_03290 [Candidatus Wolfebacteria bacterium]
MNVQKSYRGARNLVDPEEKKLARQLEDSLLSLTNKINTLLFIMNGTCDHIKMKAIEKRRGLCSLCHVKMEDHINE